MPAISPASCRRLLTGLRGRAGRRGASAVEYALIAGLVTCGIGVALVEFGPPLNQTFAAIERALDGGPGPSLSGSSGGPGSPPPGSGSGSNGGGTGGGGTGTSSI